MWSTRSSIRESALIDLASDPNESQMVQPSLTAENVTDPLGPQGVVRSPAREVVRRFMRRNESDVAVAPVGIGRRRRIEIPGCNNHVHFGIRNVVKESRNENVVLPILKRSKSVADRRHCVHGVETNALASHVEIHAPQRIPRFSKCDALLL